MDNLHWAPLVYSRTYEVDFRLLAVPNDFKTEDTNYFDQYIWATTRSTVTTQLANHPCWLLVKTDRHLLLGVTCMASDLPITLEDEKGNQYWKDKLNRPLYVFLAYACQRWQFEPHLDHLTLIPQLSLSQFAPLYQFVRQYWWEKDYEYQLRQNKLPHCPYDLPLNLSPPVSEPAPLLEPENCPPSLLSDLLIVESSSMTVSEPAPEPVIDAVEQPSSEPTIAKITPGDLNTYQTDRVYLWPCADNLELWQVAAQSPREVSVCLGLPTEQDILNSPFLNGTTLDVTVAKQKVRPPKPLPPAFKQEDDESEPESNFDRSTVPPSNQERKRRNRSVPPLPSFPSQIDLFAPLKELEAMISDILTSGLFPDKKLLQDIINTRKQLEDLAEEYAKACHNLERHQQELISINYCEALQYLAAAYEACKWRNLMSAEAELDRALQLIQNIQNTLRNRHIGFKPKSSQPRKDRAESPQQDTFDI